MSERKRQKSSEDLLREAKEGFSSSYESPTLPSTEKQDPEPVIRPSDRIASSYEPPSAPRPTAPRPRPPTPDRDASRLPDLTVPSSSLPPESSATSYERPPLTAMGKLLRIFGVIVLGLLLFMWVSLIIAVVEDPASRTDSLIGGAIFSAFLVGIAVVLFRLSGRLRMGEPPSPQTSTSQQSNQPATSSGGGSSVASYLQPGESILGQATGARPGSKGLADLLKNKGIIPVLIVASVVMLFAGGFFVLIIIGAVVARIIKASQRNQSDDPPLITLVVTDRRILAFSRKYWVSGTLVPWFHYPLADVESRTIVDEGNQPAIGMAFADGRTISVVVNKTSAIEMASAFNAAGL